MSHGASAEDPVPPTTSASRAGGRASRRAVIGGLGAALIGRSVRAQSTDLVIPVTSTSFATASLRSADVLGCFAANGLNVRTPFMDTGSTLTAALVSNSVQVALGGSGEQVAAWSRGQQILTLTNTYWGMAASVVLAKATAERLGVSATAPTSERFKALDGLLVAAPSATSSYTNSFRGAAEAAGAKMRFTYMGQPAMVAALDSGVVDGYIAGAPFWGSHVARGKAVLWLSGPKGDLPKANTPASITALHTMRGFADANPGLMKRLLASYAAFSDILVREPMRVRAALGSLYPDVEPATMDILFDAEKDAWRMRPVTAADMKQEVDFMIASGVRLPGLSEIDPARMVYVPPA